MWILLAIVAFIVVVPIVAIPAMVFLSVKGMAGVEHSFRPASAQDFPDDCRVAAQTDQWASPKGFRYLGQYSMRMPDTVFIAAWQLGESPTFFCMYGVRHKYVYDYLSLLTPERSLTTSSSREGFTLPRPPGQYCQAFENTDFDTMWHRHQESLGYLQTAGGITPQPVNTSFEEAFTGAIAEQLRYVQTIPLWPIKGLKWYYVNRSRLSNKTIQEQHRSGLIQLPADPHWRE